MMNVSVIVNFTDDTHEPYWSDGESFTQRALLPDIPAVDTEISGITDYDNREYTVKVYRVEMTVGSAIPRAYGVVV